MKPFYLKECIIHQSEKVFKVGTDSILCGSLADVDDCQRVLEIGTGTGIISLMLAQKNERLKVDAIDLDNEAFDLAKRNIDSSKFNKQIQVIHSSLQDLKTEYMWDGIISNPPYFNSGSLMHQSLSHARSQEYLSLEELLQFASVHLKEKGGLQFIYPYEQLDSILNIGKNVGLFPERIICIKGNEKAAFSRVFVHLKKGETQWLRSELIIEKERGNFTEAYRELTKDFHPMF